MSSHPDEGNPVPRHREPQPPRGGHGVPSPIRRRRSRRVKERRSSYEGTYKMPPSKPTVSRLRSRVQFPEESLLGLKYLIDNNGNKFNLETLIHYPDPIVERTFDETHGWIQTFFLVDQGEFVPKRRINGKRYREGGPFSNSKSSMHSIPIQSRSLYFGQDLRPFGFANAYEGGFVPATWSHFGYTEQDLLSVGLNGAFDSNYENPYQYGASAYKRFKPKTSFATLGVDVGEIREMPKMLKESAEGLHKLWRSLGGHPRKFGPKDAAKHFLGYQFGWSPFIASMGSMYNTYSRFDSHYDRIQRQNGSWQKRGGNVLRVFESSDPMVFGGSGVVYPALPSSFYTDPLNSVTSVLTTQTERDVWFEGSFKYYVPGFKKRPKEIGQYEKVTSMMRLLGLNVSPTLVWELTPWSWLVDWFSNAGNVIDNFSTFLTDALVSRYAYIMNHARKRLVNDSTIHLKSGDVHCSWSRVIETKKRDAASPYGFGLSSGDLTNRQKAILVALAITRFS